MESLETAALFVDNLLDFSSDIGEDDYDDADNNIKKNLPLCLNNHPQNINNSADTTFPDSDSLHASLPVLVEEELEWLSNQDAFPPIESCDISILKPENVITNNQSPVSVLGVNNSNFRVPVKARSKKRRRRRNFTEFTSQKWWYAEEPPKKKNVGGSRNLTTSSFIRRCLHCQADKTPQWRAGPLGPKTLCNACGVRYKSGRLLPEYRPANSPTFSEQMHSNSHRKVLDMRRSKQKEEDFLQPVDKGVFFQPVEGVFLQPVDKGR
ncbi:hypothetical protein ACHQM5_027801 [Ranunculus cassubicifolius]